MENKNEQVYQFRFKPNYSNSVIKFAVFHLAITISLGALLLLVAPRLPSSAWLTFFDVNLGLLLGPAIHIVLTLVLIRLAGRTPRAKWRESKEYHSTIMYGEPITIPYRPWQVTLWACVVGIITPLMLVSGYLLVQNDWALLSLIAAITLAGGTVSNLWFVSKIRKLPHGIELYDINELEGFGWDIRGLSNEMAHEIGLAPSKIWRRLSSMEEKSRQRIIKNEKSNTPSEMIYYEKMWLLMTIALPFVHWSAAAFAGAFGYLFILNTFTYYYLGTKEQIRKLRIYGAAIIVCGIFLSGLAYYDIIPNLLLMVARSLAYI